jgi:hypothetical protein
MAQVSGKTDFSRRLELEKFRQQTAKITFTTKESNLTQSPRPTPTRCARGIRKRRGRAGGLKVSEICKGNLSGKPICSRVKRMLGTNAKDLALHKGADGEQDSNVSRYT